MSDPNSDVESIYTNEEDISVDSIGLSPSKTQARPPQSPPPRTLPDAGPFKVRTTPFTRPGDRPHSPNILILYNYPRTPIWTSADDGEFDTAENDPDSPTKLLQKFEQSTVTRLPVGRKALCSYVCADSDGDDP